jgi:dGTPase
MSFVRPASSLTNDRFEEGELTLLAPYAMHTRDSLGRRWLEPDHPYRPAYVRDRDRIVHAAAFRRLAFKTQVFVDQQNDHHRSRLTHTLEVVQIARTVARNLRLNEDLTEAIALAHDLGHPPFGHAGERVLAELMAGDGGFEHNSQGLRLVEILESRYPQFQGLNLSYEVLESMALHALKSGAPAIEGFDPGRRMLAECQVVDLADDIAYSTHDIDDALRQGLINFDDLADLELWREACQRARSTYGLDLEGKQFSRSVIRSLIDLQVGSMITESRRRLSGVDSVDDVRRSGDDVVALPDKIARAKAELREFLYRRVYRHEFVTERTALGGDKVRRLFNRLLADPSLIPEKFRRRIDETVARQACDYIASMTDRFAQKTCEALLGDCL